ncbi:MAG: aspartate kinase [Flavobacteriia bacterium]|nr:aspartate kinase [Flavobacteriia bacterium]
MLIFKFGGASVKDADSIKNVLSILKKYPEKKIIVIVSAIGKTTNNLEKIYQSILNKDKVEFELAINLFYNEHLKIINDLELDTNSSPFQYLEQIKTFFENKFSSEISDNHFFEYDQIVSLGEIMSSIILETYVSKELSNSCFLDARKVLRTDNNFRQADVVWNKTMDLVNNFIQSIFNSKTIVITQGFIGHTAEGFTTTLGREGSDFSAAIFAYCVNAESVTIWKDVPGMLNADPKYFDNTQKLDSISYKEAIELSYYGASVIHPKTVKPLQNKNIPLFIKSFFKPELEGSVIHTSEENDDFCPSFIFKKEQILFSISTKDFSFINENELSEIFQILASKKIKVNLMQNSALSFSFAVDQNLINTSEIIELFEKKHLIKYNENLELLTIRHYNTEVIQTNTKNKSVILEQKTRSTVRFLLKN